MAEDVVSSTEPDRPPDPGVDRRRAVRVLIVDDDVDHQLLMRRSLEGRGARVDVAADGATALEVLSDHDVALIDYRLPDTTGLDLIHTINEDDDPPACVLVTAQGGTEVVVQALREGAADYVTKDASYLRDLPVIVDRTFRAHDLRRRASALQALALVVSDADGVADAFRAVVEGARSLLRASRTVIAVEDGLRLRVEATAGTADVPVAAVIDNVMTDLPPAGEGRVLADGTLAVSLPTQLDEPLGVLIIEGLSVDDEQLAGELDLARAFAAFAGTAVRNLRRAEIERSLVAELQRTVEARRDFVASVSHELRTPLTSIGGYAQTVLNHWDELTDEQRLDFIGKVQGHAVDLGRIIEDLIDLAAMERGRTFTPNIRNVALRGTVTDAVEAMAHFTDGRAIQVDLPEVAVAADVELVRRTVTNLVSNAIKYSAPGTAIHVSGRAGERSVVVEVTDHGIGMTPGDAARVFEPFFRSPYAVSNAVRGSGIGLALVREYVRAMGGEVGVSSELGHGSTFSFTVPLAAT